MASLHKEKQKQWRKERRERMIKNLISDIKSIPTSIDIAVSNTKRAIRRKRIEHRLNQLERQRAENDKIRARADEEYFYEPEEDDVEEFEESDYEDYKPRPRAEHRGSGAASRGRTPYPSSSYATAPRGRTSSGHSKSRPASYGGGKRSGGAESGRAYYRDDDGRHKPR